MNADCQGIIYLSEGRWLSWGKMPKDFMICKMKSSHLWNQKKIVPELEDEEGLIELAFLVDLITRFNKFNMHFQCENQLTCFKWLQCSK